MPASLYREQGSAPGEFMWNVLEKAALRQTCKIQFLHSYYNFIYHFFDV
jgi:hypothetical protein